jgi:hypothetical protein
MRGPANAHNLIHKLVPISFAVVQEFYSNQMTIMQPSFKNHAITTSSKLITARRGYLHYL